MYVYGVYPTDGSAAFLLFGARDNITVQGDTKIFSNPADSGNILHRGYCAACYS